MAFFEHAVANRNRLDTYFPDSKRLFIFNIITKKDTIEVYVEDDDYQSVFNSNHEVKIGTNYFKSLSKFIIAEISNSNSTTLTSVRQQGIFAPHQWEVKPTSSIYYKPLSNFHGYFILIKQNLRIGPLTGAMEHLKRLLIGTVFQKDGFNNTIPTWMKNLFRKWGLLLISLFLSAFIYSQQRSISVSYGRFWAAYNYVDEGNGFKNARQSNWSNYPSISYNSPLTPSADLEYFFTYARYAQYFSTNRHPGAFYSNYGVGYLGIRYAHAVLRETKTELRIKGGMAIGIMPDQYEGTFERLFVYPYTDSITRGTINRSFTPIFPMVSGGIDLVQRVKTRLGISLQFDYCKGFSTITEYDVYYNNGSGHNDQHARQWGKGSYIGFQVGVKYYLN